MSCHFGLSWISHPLFLQHQRGKKWKGGQLSQGSAKRSKHFFRTAPWRIIRRGSEFWPGSELRRRQRHFYEEWNPIKLGAGDNARQLRMPPSSSSVLRAYCRRSLEISVLQRVRGRGQRFPFRDGSLLKGISQEEDKRNGRGFGPGNGSGHIYLIRPSKKSWGVLCERAFLGVRVGREIWKILEPCRLWIIKKKAAKTENLKVD